MTKLRPLNNNILIHLDSRQEQSPGGIAIPARAQKAEEWGTTIACGPKAEHLIPGDRVYVPPHLGTHYIENGQDLIIIDEGRILARQDRVEAAMASPA